jgi:TRAP-type mannitol/chloroaromatic compound transport system permease small subunit
MILDPPYSFSIFKKIHSLSKCIDGWTEWLGRTVAWLIIVMILLMVSIVLLRYGFHLGWIAMQEAVVYCHACFFMMGTAYALKHNEHVRVDIFYRQWSQKKQAWVNWIGHIFLLFPVCFFILYMSWDYVLNSWIFLEKSREAGGIPGVFLLKSLIPLLSLTLMLQSFSECLKSWLVIVSYEAISSKPLSKPLNSHIDLSKPSNKKIT